MPSRNVICRVKFGRFWTFDRRRPSWILRKLKNSSTGLFLGSTNMSMPNCVQIRWTESKCQAKMWFFPPQHPHPHPPSVTKQFIELSGAVGAKNTTSMEIFSLNRNLLINQMSKKIRKLRSWYKKNLRTPLNSREKIFGPPPQLSGKILVPHYEWSAISKNNKEPKTPKLHTMCIFKVFKHLISLLNVTY